MSVRLPGKWLLCKSGYLLRLALCLAYPLFAQAQDGSHLAPGVKVLTTLKSLTAAWSPDGARLAYMTHDGIWVVEAPDFQQAKRLIRKGQGGGGSYPLPQLMWSPDGQKLAFMDSRPGDGWSTIWVADADGSHVRDLLPPGAPFGSPGSRSVEINAWLNNREIAFTHGCGTECADLYTVDVENGTYQALYTGGGIDGGYYWAPTKDRAIVELHLGGLGLVEGKSRRPFRSDVVFSSPVETGPVLVGCTSGEEGLKGEWYRVNDWSPDGKQVLYTGQNCEDVPLVNSGSHLYLWTLESGRQQTLLSNAGWASWSPDGSQIAFLLFGKPRYDQSKRIIGTDFTADKPVRVYLGIMEATSRAVHILVPLDSEPVEREKVSPLRPLWSPTGRHLIAWNTQGNLFLLRADGSGRRPLTQMTQLEFYCDATCTLWSPDGKRLAVWPKGRYLTSDEDQGLKRFFPPVGKEDAALTDAEVIERYFHRALALGPDALPTYPWFLTEYAEALRKMGKAEAAEEHYRKTIEQVRRSEQWRGTGVEVYAENSYVAFLCQQGREKEAAEFIASAPLLQRNREISRRGFGPQAAKTSPCGEGRGGRVQSGLEQPTAETPSASQQFPLLYLIEVPER